METEIEGRLELETPFAVTELVEDRDLRRDVWEIAWPSVVTFSLMTTNSILDRAFVGQLGPDALAGVGFGGQVLFLVVSLSMAVTVGATALVARFTGAEEHENAVTATGQSATLGVFMGLACMAAIAVVLGPLLASEGLGAGAQRQCAAFLRMGLLGTVPLFILSVIAAAFRGTGDTRTPLKVMICMNLVHVTLDWTLMLGHWGAPKLGLPGGGIALASSNTIGAAVFLWLLRSSPLADSLYPRHLRLQKEWALRILRIGIPAAFTAVLRVTSLMAFTGILARTAEQTFAVAALPIGMTAESIAFMPGFGYSTAASALVGQALGARRPDRAMRYGWSATWQAVSVMSVMGLVFYVLASPFCYLFTHDQTVHALAVSYLRIMALSEPFLAVGIVLTGGLQGAGETLRPTSIVVLAFWLFRLPFARLLALDLHMNTAGCWIAMAASTTLSGLLTAVIWQRGAWKRVRV